MDRFQSIRCLNDPIDLSYMMGSLASGTINSLVAKLELKILPHLAQSIHSEIMDGFWCSWCLNDRINLPYMIVSLASASLTPWWPKLVLNILPNLAQSVDSELMDGFWCSRCLNYCIGLPHIVIGSLASSATSSLVAKNWTKKLSQPFEELQGSNSEFKLITPKPIIRTYF